MAISSSSGFEQWVYGIGRSRHGRPGKTDTRRGSSARSDGIVLTMLLCSASGIFAICSILTKNITTRLERTYRCTRTRRSRVPSRLSVARWQCQFWAACITDISERKFPTGTEVVGGELVVRFGRLRSVETHCRSATGDRSRSRASTSARPRLVQLACSGSGSPR